MLADFNHALLSNAQFLMPFAFKLTQDYEEARDLFQETLCKALANKEKYNIGTNLKAWLYTIMRNIFINDYRRKNRQQLTFDATDSDHYINSIQAVAYNNAIAAINIKEIKSAIINLPEIFRDPFVLYFDGYKYTEIADILSEPLGTIKSRVHFARKLLKKQIERY
jgi:RNA polymerase sigma-70 factor (ECF subfamily)